jgi:hypothetical protein
MTPQEIATEIGALNMEGLAELKRLLDERGPGGEAVGVREPRNPYPSDDEAGWPVPHNLPEDYWESAQ